MRGEPMLDIRHEELLSLAEAAQRLPNRRMGRPVSPSCIWRWIVEGVKGPTGQRVRLEGAKVGGAWLTSVEALERFIVRLTPTEPQEQAGAVTPAARARQKAKAADLASELVG